VPPPERNSTSPRIIPVRSTIAHYRVQSETADRYLNHMSVAQGEIQLLDSGLDHIEDIMVRAKELGIAAMSGSTNDEDRKTYANQIGMLFDELLQAANNQTNGQYVFAGYQDKTAPFHRESRI
jgi:flagellar hook-associated protein 3 FlgL